MNSIVRIILRGLLSGEIQPEPQVFEYLRELGEREFQRHSRILRLVQPAEPAIRGETRQASEEPSLGQGTSGNSGSSETFPAGLSTPHDRSTFASIACGRWIRVTSCLLVGFFVLGLGAADAQVGISDDVRATPSVVAAESWAASLIPLPAYGAIPVLSRMAQWVQPIPQIPLLVAGVLLVGLLLHAGYRKFWHHWLFTMRPYEIALQELEAAQFQAEQGLMTDFRGAVRGILQKYLRAQFQLSLPEAGPDVLGRAAKMGGIPFTSPQRLLLLQVLAASPEGPGVDRARFIELSERASGFVWATACCRPVKRLRERRVSR